MIGTFSASQLLFGFRLVCRIDAFNLVQYLAKNNVFTSFWGITLYIFPYCWPVVIQHYFVENTPLHIDLFKIFIMVFEFSTFYKYTLVLNNNKLISSSLLIQQINPNFQFYKLRFTFILVCSFAWAVNIGDKSHIWTRLLKWFCNIMYIHLYRRKVVVLKY